ncbi:MAG: DinB family protein [Cyclobacteriaceae bacterium]|nr:DinB family protein [Cyclobacteriaceae bacterium]
MTKPEIQNLLVENYASFLAVMRRMPDVQAHMAAPGKWSPAQQAEHLVKSVRPVTLAFTLPKFLLPLIFGRSNRPSRTFDELVARYQAKLTAGGRASNPFIPGIPRNLDRVYRRLGRTVDQLRRRIDRFTESELDTLILPHPLLGKLTLREMLYFTAYHAKHHQHSIEATHSPA